MRLGVLEGHLTQRTRPVEHTQGTPLSAVRQPGFAAEEQADAVGTDDDGVDGCAGLSPVTANADNGLAGVFPDGGGDGFDLGAIGVDRAVFVRLHDRSSGGSANNAGFDLDAISVRSY